MKTPEEIKKGLECCVTRYNCHFDDEQCCYHGGGASCHYDVMKDALARIEQLEAENNALKQAAQDAIKRIKNARQAAERIDERLSQLKRFGTDMNVPRWISVEERLPESDDDVLIITEFGISMGYYDIYQNYWLDYTNGDSNIVSRWMPLPEPPKEG